jgi:ABC-type Fe3+ transport system permease subunit
LEYFWQWIVGSLVLATVVAALGTVTTYAVARLVQRK